MRFTLIKIVFFCLGLLSPGTLVIYAQCGPTVNLGADITFCSGNSLSINALDPACPNATYLWNNGPGTPTIVTTPSITITASGTYYVTVFNGVNSATDSIRITVDNPPAIFLGVDQNICAGSTKLLSVPFSPNNNYVWSTSDTTNFINVSAPGTYHVTVTNSCGLFTDTIVIGNDTPPTLSLPVDTAICTDSSYVIRPLSLNGALTWSSPNGSDSLVVSETGTYYATASNSCGSTTDSIRVTFNDGIKLRLPDTIRTCPGVPVNISVNLSSNALANGSLLWSNNSTSQSITVGNAGYYWVDYTNVCGTVRDSVYLSLTSTTLNVDLGADTTICDNVIYTLNPNVIGSSYLWSTNSTSPTINISNPGLYWVQVNTTCGTFRDSIQIGVIPAPRPSVPDTLRFCYGDSVTATAGPPPNNNRTYLWSGGGISNRKTFSQPGNYWVRRTENCGIVSQQFIVIEDRPRNIVLDSDTFNCVPGKLIFIDTGYFATDSISWSNGVKNSQNIVIKDTGWYSVQVFNNCGVFEDSIYLDHQRPPDIPDLEVYICSNDSAKIGHLSPQPGVKYLWSGTGDTTSFIYASMPGTYTLTASNICDTLIFNINVIEVSQNLFSNILGADTMACLRDSVIVSIGSFPHDSVRWFNLNPMPGDTMAFTRFSRTQGSSGRVEVYNECGVFYDTISIDRLREPSVTINDTSFCFGDSVLLDATDPSATNYLWSTGDTTASIFAKNGGPISVTVFNRCFSSSDTANMNLKSSLDQIDLGEDTIFCQGILLLDPGLTGANLSYVWQDNSTNPTYTVGVSGTYYVTISDSCGSVSDTINVIITGLPQLILGTSVKYCSNNTLTLNAQNFGSKYLWNTGDTSQTLTIPAPGKYWVTISNLCDTITDTVDVIIEYPFANLDLGVDTAICPGDTLRLQTGYPNDQTLWQDSTNLPYLNVSQPGKYFVTLTNSCEARTDSINISFRGPPEFWLGNDTSYCDVGDKVVLQGPVGNYNYLWNNNSTDSAITVTQPGTYWLEITDFCGLTWRDSINVEADVAVEIDLGRDTVLCPGEGLLLQSGISDYDVYWDNGAIGPDRRVDGSGIYTATVINDCGIFKDSIRIDIIENIDINPSEYRLCEGDTVIIDLTDPNIFDGGSTDGYQIFWEDGFPDSVRVITEGGSYELTLRNRCNDYAKTFTVETALCECPLYIPNAFSPNGDARNELFKISSPCSLTNYNLIIFNRWGQQVFRSNDIESSWDGTTQGEIAPGGVYSYRLIYEWSVFEQDFAEEKVGVITVIR